MSLINDEKSTVSKSDPCDTPELQSINKDIIEKRSQR